MPESCSWALELFIGLQSLLLLPPSKHIRPQDTNNYIQLSVMIHSGPKAGITAWGEIVLFAPLLGLSLRVRSSLEIRDREKQTDTNYHHPSPSTLHISPTILLDIPWLTQEVLHTKQHSHVVLSSQGQQTNENPQRFAQFCSEGWLLTHMAIKWFRFTLL